MAHVRLLPLFSLLAALLLPCSADAADDLADHSGWSLNFTPVLVFPTSHHGYGGGADPELRYTLDLGGARLSAGTRVGVYYAKDVLGVTVMPTLRLTIPVGPFEPYAAFGMGYGWLPQRDRDDIASMSRLGFVIRFSPRFALGAEGTVQRIDRTEFRFLSFGSMVSFDF